MGSASSVCLVSTEAQSAATEKHSDRAAPSCRACSKHSARRCDASNPAFKHE